MKERLSNLLDDLDTMPVECDGMARLVATRLATEGITYKAKAGSLEVNGQVIQPHFWIEAGNCVIDYRARMWVPAEITPHGVMLQSEVEGMYQGIDYPGIQPLPKFLYDILTAPILGVGQPVEVKRAGSIKLG